ncbi:MAG: hypothetical protein KKC66_03325, partial [Candidatus Omnitrophica bacterium]|nr:hypothetical protein [Candidatus Omnitrophota bacterium]MBU1932914.1 hypothetical protein [Candidatus Omnitrophota bacterium]
YKQASENFYSIDRHFSLYLSRPGTIPKSVIKGAWCAIIAEDSFKEKTEEEIRQYAEKFFDEEIRPLAQEQGYNVAELRDWFLRYAAFNIKTMPIKEYLLDWKGEKGVLYREIGLTKKPSRKISYFYASPDLPKDAFWILLVAGFPAIVLYFAIHKYFRGI